MKSDKSRETFDAKKHYSSVRLQQGRVLTDADWNEQSDIIEHRDETTSTDVIGQAGVPVGADGFQIGDNGDGNLTISAGRMYVDGILNELESATTYFSQPDAPFDAGLVAVQPVPFGRVLAFLDVWQRHIGIVEDPFIREVALGGPDTASRAKTTWQVKLRGFDPATTSVDALLASLTPGIQQGKIAARAEPSDAPTDPCTIPQAAGFRSLENQLYRVEVHTSGQLTADGSGGAGPNGAASIAPTFKWSRDNGSVVAEWIEDAEGIPGTIRVKLLTTDETRGFAKGQWIELLDDRRELSDVDISGLHTGFIQSGLGGVFVRIDHVEGDRLFLDTTTVQDPLAGFGITDPLAFPGSQFHPKVRRWDMPVDSGGPQPIIRVGAQGWIDLEAGVQIQFQEGYYNVGDYWLIPARTASGSIEWPPISPNNDAPAQLLPRGITHHVACLATFDADGTEVVFEFGPFADCRKRFHPLTDITPATPIDQPKPNEYRYYLVDGSEGTGDDNAGTVGVAMNPGPAYANAIPFFTVNAALAKFPRDGNGSFAIFMLQGSPASGTNYGNFILPAVHGYRKVLIRGSNFALGGTKAESIPSDDWNDLGGSSVLGRFLTLDPQLPTPSASNVLNLDRQFPLTEAADSLVGSRVRFEDTSSLGAFSTMVLGNIPGGGNNPGGQITTGDAFFSVPGGNDRFSLAQPAVFLTDVFIGIVGTDSASPPEEGPVTSAGLAVAGLNMSSLDLRGTFYGEVAFCQTGFLRLSRFVQLKINGTYTDELSDDGSHITGVGVNVANSLTVSDGDELLLANSAAGAAVIRNVDALTVPQGYFSSETVIDGCQRFSIGAPLQLPSSSRLVRIGAGATVGATLRISHSDGEVQGTAFDMVNLHQSFRFNADDGVTQSAIRFEGTGHSLRLRDIDLTQARNNTPSGVLLDATGAVASNIDYDQRGAFGANPDLQAVVVSGLIALPGRSMFRPWELSYTDFRDPADNHYFSPDVSTKSVQAGMNTLAAAQARTFIHRGFAAQATDVNGNNMGVTRYRVVQFVGDGTSRVRMAGADLTDPVTGVKTTADVVAAAIAGVSQHGVIAFDGSEQKKQFTTVVSTGYSLVSLEGLPASGLRLPAPVYLAGSWGQVTTNRPVGTTFAAILIGSLIRVVAQSDLGDTGSGDSVVGLVRLNIQLAPPPPTPVVP